MNSNRIQLNQDNRNTTFLLFALLYFTTGAIVSLIIYHNFPRLFVLVGCLMVFICIFLLIQKAIKKYIATGYLQDEYIVVKSLTEKSFILDHHYIKKIKTIRCLFFTITQIQFKFDGVKYKMALFSNHNVSKNINNLLNQLVSKKKASHKPGSVNLSA